MQRLFSAFPGGSPGLGLLLLRIAAGASLIAGRFTMLGALALELRVVGVVVGILILAGLWTPIVGGVAAIVELLISFPHAGYNLTHILLATLALSLALLGPGAWSVDARIFGRKRIDIKVG